MTRWFERYRDVLSRDLEPGETLLDADRARVSRPRRTPRAFPRRGFILGVTDRRIVVWNASTWLARPLDMTTAWSFPEGVALTNGALGRLHLVLPDRSVVTLCAYSSWSIRHLGRAVPR